MWGTLSLIPSRLCSSVLGWIGLTKVESPGRIHSIKVSVVIWLCWMHFVSCHTCHTRMRLCSHRVTLYQPFGARFLKHTRRLYFINLCIKVHHQPLTNHRLTLGYYTSGGDKDGACQQRLPNMIPSEWWVGFSLDCQNDKRKEFLLWRDLRFEIMNPGDVLCVAWVHVQVSNWGHERVATRQGLKSWGPGSCTSGSSSQRLCVFCEPINFEGSNKASGRRPTLRSSM